MPFKAVSGLVTLFVRCATNVEIPTSAVIGPGLFIGHAGPIVINGTAVIGHNCSMGVGVVIGTQSTSLQAPHVGDNVKFAAYAVALGDITIGDGAHVGAMSLVVRDVEPGMIVVGIPAKPLRPVGAPKEAAHPNSL